MISYKQWKLLKESLGDYSLGLRTPNSIGLVNNHTSNKADEAGCDCGNLEEMDMPGQSMGGGGDMNRPMNKGKRPFPPHKDMDHDDDMDDNDDLEGHEDDDHDGNEDGEDHDGDEHEDDDHDGEDHEDDDHDNIDPDADFEDGEDEDGDEGDNANFAKKKSPMGEPHKDGAFMQFSRRMKKEACGDDKDDADDDELKDDDELVGKGEDKDKELSFTQKKGMKKKMASGKKANPFKKGCSVDDDGAVKKCAKCKKKKKDIKETSYDDYRRPKPTPTGDDAFVRSLKSMYGNPYETFSDGLKDVTEDLLLHPDLAPGEAGFPQSYHQKPAVTESLDALQKRISQLEKQLKRK